MVWALIIISLITGYFLGSITQVIVLKNNDDKTMHWVQSHG